MSDAEAEVNAPAAGAEAGSSPSTASNLEATSAPTAFPSTVAVPPGYRKAGSLSADPIQKNKQLDFFACAGIIFAVGAICAAIMVGLHLGVLTHEKYILNPNKTQSYEKLPRIQPPVTPADQTTTAVPGSNTTANPNATTATTTVVTTTTTPAPAPPGPPAK